VRRYLLMKVDPSLTPEQFRQLLDWLDPDPARAGEKYEAIRRRLITIFLNRRCDEAEDLADETINRVARKAAVLKESFVGEPANYFYGVAKKVFLEHVRRCNKRPLPPPPAAAPDEIDPYLKCLDECLEKLSPENRKFILDYYEEQKQAKITAHKEMSARLKLNPGALRARVHRIRGKLEKCVLECLEREAESNDVELKNI
jgi:DNA-directed RNA polymerase specialized sigma24 family protein